MLTPNEMKAKKYLFDFFIPTLHDLIETANPEAYLKWNRNTCRQSAVFGCHFLNKLLPEYEWTAWDGNFEDVYLGRKVKYNHAWIYGSHKTRDKHLLVDLSVVNKERLFIERPENTYPKDHPEYEHMIEVDRKQLDYRKMIENEIEYYTQLSGPQVVHCLELGIQERIERQKLRSMNQKKKKKKRK